MLREKERSREREKEERDKGHYYGHMSDGSRKDRSGSLGGGDLHRLPRAEELGLSRFGSITQGTAKDIHNRKDSRADKGQESDRSGREGERGSVPLPSNLEHSYKREEKYSQLFSTGSKVSMNESIKIKMTAVKVAVKMFIGSRCDYEINNGDFFFIFS